MLQAGRAVYHNHFPRLLYSRGSIQRYTVWKFLMTCGELFASKTITKDNHETHHFLHDQKRRSAPSTYRSSLVTWWPLGQVHRLEPRSHRGSQKPSRLLSHRGLNARGLEPTVLE